MTNATIDQEIIAEASERTLIETKSERLNATDRCDSCGAQAYIAATVNGTELLFCAHHGRKGEEKLRKIASHWHDETHKLSA